jgi:hypothetical protein
MTHQVDEFIRRVNETMAQEDTETIHHAIEDAYEECIVGNAITKSVFLSELAASDQIFTLTVEHLFTPINWSRVKLRTLWAVRNEATGNLLTLERDEETDVYRLRDSTDDPTLLIFAPMLSGSEADTRLFIKMLMEQLPKDAPVGLGETVVKMSVDEHINLANLKAVQIRLIF